MTSFPQSWRLKALAALCAGALAASIACSSGPRTAYVPHDASLRDQPLFFYPARRTPARAFIFFLGNDVGFWKPHQELAWRLSKEGYDVVGIDIKKYLARLPEGEPQRDSSFAASMPGLIARVRHEMDADTLPMIIGGHSFGAELAFWIAWKEPPPRLAGVLALSPRSSGHFVVTPFDLMNYEASGPWSFSTIEAAKEIAPGIRIAIVRGASDKFRKHDSAFVAAGGARLHRYRVPFAGHSLQSLILAGPIVEHAVEFLLAGR